MADDSQDLEMEDILSSIKNILEEDEKTRTQAAADTDVLDDVLNATEEADSIDSILELSPDMRLANEPEPTVAAEPESKLESEPEPKPIFEVTPEFVPEPEPEPEPVEETVAEVAPAVESEEPAVAVDEPVWNLEPKPEPEPIVEAAPEFVSEPEPEPIVEAVSEFVPEPEPEPVVEAVSEPAVADQVFESSEAVVPAVEEPKVVEPEFAEPVVEPKVEETEVVAEKTAVDASANIISNFAKLFARETHVTAPAAMPEPETEVRMSGDMGKTLEELVCDSITKVIGRQVERKWNDGADFRALAEAEIRCQTMNWLNEHLPMLVEKVVKEEIDRVIAKVSS
jgi:cell pole-organizing protein PopZ